MREQERKESLAMNDGRVMTREVADIIDAGMHMPRPRVWNAGKRQKPAAYAPPGTPTPGPNADGLPIGASSAFSPHVVDLSPFANRPTIGPRPDLDFEQRLNVFAHTVRSAVSSPFEEHRALLPRKPKKRAAHAPIGGFLRLPFALIALPFKTRQLIRARMPKPIVRKAVTSPQPAAPAPVAPVSVPTPVQSVAASTAAARVAVPDPFTGVDAQAPQAHAPSAAPRSVASFAGTLPLRSHAPTSHETLPSPLPPPKAIVIQTMPRVAREVLFLPQNDWRRRVVAFAIIALVISLPLQMLLSYGGLVAKAGAIAAGVKDAASGLQDAGQSALALDGTSRASFDRAAGAFAETHDRVDDISVRLAALLTGNGQKLASGGHLLTAGEAVSRAGSELAAGLDNMRQSQGTVAQKLAAMTAALDEALPQLEISTSEFAKVSERSLPEALRVPFTKIRDDAGTTVGDLKRASAASGILLDAIGANGKRRYLVVFQNSNELRPTGGFIGSYALMDLQDGSIKNIEIPAGGSYDLRSGFNQLIAAPQQLRLVNPRWEFQDANWFADFPTSAQALTWFYEKSGGPTVDGVIAITSNVMQDLLRQVGPIALPENGKTITADNFMTETQKSVEIEFDHVANRPKQVISDMAPKILKKLIDGGAKDLPALASVLGKSLASKDIQVYFSDTAAQTAAADFGWTGALQPVDGADFLSVVDTNIAGGKTDGVVSEDTHHESRVEKDGSIVDTLTVTRIHHGVLGELFTGIKNIDYLRVYVPLGSELLSSEGFKPPGEGYFLPQDSSLKPSTLLAAVEGSATTDPANGTRISQESGLTVFGNWVQLEPGQSRTVKISYRLPFRIQDLTKRPTTDFERARATLGLWTPTAAMKLVVRKQPGASNRTFSSRMYVPDGWQIRSSVPEQAASRSDGLALSTPLDKDIYVGLLLVKHD